VFHRYIFLHSVTVIFLIKKMGTFWTLFRHEARMEFRRPAALWMLILYLACTLFICFQVFGPLQNPDIFGALFWVIMVFSAVQAAHRSFGQESAGRQVYLYFLSSAIPLMMARLFWAVCSGWIWALGALALFFGLLEGPVNFSLSGVIGVVLSATFSLNVIMTFVGAVAARAGQGQGMAAILGLPLLMPVLVMATVAFGKALIADQTWSHYLWMLGAIGSGTAVAGTVLFPYLWRD
jgi:heme exporter protein B